MDFSVVIPCKGRLAHLKETLPVLAKQVTNFQWEIVVVDYDCPDGTYFWLNSRAVRIDRVLRYIKVGNKPWFNRSHACNIGVMRCESPSVAVCDADCLVKRGLVQHLWDTLWGGDGNVVGCLNPPRTGDHGRGRGIYAFRRAAFLAIRGHDEELSGWGGEEQDFANRLARVGRIVGFPRRYCQLIEHGDELRVQHYQQKDIKTSQALNFRRVRNPEREVNPKGFGKC